jgi:hypothetical protein
VTKKTEEKGGSPFAEGICRFVPLDLSGLMNGAASAMRIQRQIQAMGIRAHGFRKSAFRRIWFGLRYEVFVVSILPGRIRTRKE